MITREGIKMKTVHEVSRLAGVSIRTLQYYDTIGLLKPAEYSESGYRLYDDTDLERLQQILLFRELEFPLRDIKEIMESSDFDRKKALDQQIKLLTLKKEHLENLISFARELKRKGAKTMDFTAFDTSAIDEYTKRAKAQWGDTKEFKESEEKSSKRTAAQTEKVMADFMAIFAEFGALERRQAGRSPTRIQRSAGAGGKTQSIHHGAFLHLHERNPCRTWQDVRCGRRIQTQYRRGRRRRHGRLCKQGDCSLLQVSKHHTADGANRRRFFAGVFMGLPVL